MRFFLCLSLIVFTAINGEANAKAEDVFDPTAVQQCTGSTLDMSHCILAERDKALVVLRHIESSILASLAQHENPDIVAMHKETLGKLSNIFKEYHQTFARHAALSFYDGSIRQIMAPSAEHQLIVQHIGHLMELCDYPNDLPKQFSLTRIDWCHHAENEAR